jgi:hypothetical protein
MFVRLVFKQAMKFGVVSRQGMIMSMVFQRAKIVGLVLYQFMILEMTIQQTIIIWLVLTTISDYMNGICASNDGRPGFRASCDVLFYNLVNIHNHLFVLLTVTPVLWLCDHVAGTKAMQQFAASVFSAKTTTATCSSVKVFDVYQYWRCHSPQ